MTRPPIILGLIAGATLAAGLAFWQPGIRVVDGDTVDHGFWRWRLAGFNTPEIQRAKCPEERARGLAARERLIALTRDGSAVLRPLGPIWKRDPWGRRLASLEVGGSALPEAGRHDAGAILIREGLARPYDGGKRAPWCPAP